MDKLKCSIYQQKKAQVCHRSLRLYFLMCFHFLEENLHGMENAAVSSTKV